MSQLKLIALIISMLFVTGCKSIENLTATNTTTSFVTDPTDSMISDDYSDQNTLMSDGYYGYDKKGNDPTEFYESARFANRYPYNVNLEVVYAPRFDFPSPIGTDIIVIENETYIGLPVGDIDINPYYYPSISTQLKADDWYQSIYDGRGYLYYGQLNEVSPGVYIPEGRWVDDLSKFENFADEGVDFYLIYKYECIYLFFEKVDIDTVYDQIQFGLPHYTKIIEGAY